MITKKLLVSIYILVFLSACGGGGETSPSIPDITISGTNTTGATLVATGSSVSNTITGSSSFSLKAKPGDRLTITATKQGHICSLNGTTINPISTDVTNLSITCTPLQYSLKVTISGLMGSTTVGLSNGTDSLISGNSTAAKTLSALVSYGATYNALVSTQPIGQTCTIANGNGTMATSDITLSVSCVPNNYTVGGTASGNTSPITALNNSGNAITAAINGSFTFTPQSYGSTYSVTISPQPTDQVCLVFNNWGNVGTSNITNVTITCSQIQGIVSTLAGTGVASSLDGSHESATFSAPRGIAIDTAGNIYIADTANNKVRRISPAGIVETFAGSGSPAYIDGIGTGAAFNAPRGIAVDSSGYVYVADTGNNKIRKISPLGSVSTIASTTTFNGPYGITVDNNKNTYVTDSGNHRIRKISSSGVVTTIAGTGIAGSTDGSTTSAQFNFPTGIALDSVGNIYIADSNNHKIRKINISLGTVSTLAGSGSPGKNDGLGETASFNYPYGLTVDLTGNVYVSDSLNHLIRKITSNGLVTTFAGSGLAGKTNGTGSASEFNYPYGIAVNSLGYLIVTDRNNNLIRQIIPSSSTYPIGGTLSGLTESVELINNGGDAITLTTNSSFNFYNLVIGSNYDVRVKTQPAGQTCLVLNGSGTVSTSNITNISVSCSGDTYTLSITVKYEQPGDVTGYYTPPAWSSPTAKSVPFVWVELQKSNGTAWVGNYADSQGVVTFTNLNPAIKYTPVVRSKSKNASGFELSVVNNTAPISTTATRVSTRYLPYEDKTTDYIPTNSNPIQSTEILLKTGWNPLTYSLDDSKRVSAPYAIIDMINKVEDLGYQTALATSGSTVTSSPLYVLWSTTNKGGSTSFTKDFDNGLVDGSGGYFNSGYYSISFSGLSDKSINNQWINENIIYLSGDPVFEMMEFGGVVAAHEAFHFILSTKTRKYSTGGSHSSTEYNDISLVFNEGFADGIPLLVNERKTLSRPRIYQGQIISSAKDYSTQTPSSPVGWFQEMTIARMIWNLYNPSGLVNLSKTQILSPMFSAAWQNGAWTPNIWAYGKIIKDQNPNLMSSINDLGATLNITFANNDEWGNAETILGDKTQTQTLPIFTTIPINSPTQVCSVGDANEYNKLGNRRWLRFTGDGRYHNISITGPINSVPYLTIRDITDTGAEFNLLPKFSSGTSGLNTRTASSVYIPSSGLVGEVGECSVIYSEDPAASQSACNNPAPAPYETCWTITVSP